MKGGRNQEGYADPTATIAVGRVAKEDAAQLEWCRQWSEEHKKKMTRKMQKKIRRVQHWCNCKLYVKYAWYEFRAMVKG